MKQFNADNYVKFALNTAIEGSWGFTSYTDLEGNSYRAIQGFLSPGVPRNYDVYWSTTERIRRVPANKKIKVLRNGDETTMLEVEYMKNHPCCAESPNNHPQQAILFKVLDPIKDAEISVSRRKRQNDAVNKAFALEGKELDDMATLLGVFVDDPMFKLDRVSEFAKQDPELFFKYYESGDKSVRATLRKALSLNKLKKVGEAIFWEKESLGGNEDQAVAYLVQNPEKLEALNALIGFVPQKPLNTKKAK